MKSFKEFYIEGKQVGILYHYTTLRYLLQIIDMDRLGSTAGTRHVSFTRDKNFHHHRRVGIYPEVRFVIDGDRLAHNYQIHPYNFFSNKNLSGERSRRHSGSYDEQEEQVLGPVNYLSRYVIKVQILKKELDGYFDAPYHGDEFKFTGGRTLTLTKEQFLDWIKKYYEVELI